MSVYVGLVHHPVLDRVGDVITTAVTNLDVHDIARTARTYDLAGYFVITPIEAQHRLVERILSHWRDGAGARRVPERTEALRRCEVAETLDHAIARVESMEGDAPLLVATSAREGGETVEYAAAAERMRERPALVLFGTGHGLAPAVLERTDFTLAPIRAGGDYNHLSVRAAVAITLDRLLGERGG